MMSNKDQMTPAAESGEHAVCEGCGLQIQGGASGCHGIFEELLARDSSNPPDLRVHRMMVDTYCLQHPERYCRSSKSLASHLVSLCSMIEADEDRATGADAIREWLDGRSPAEKTELPSSRGELTIEHVRDSQAPEEHAEAVEQWARTTWEAYSPLHDLARSWLEEAMSQQTR